MDLNPLEVAWAAGFYDGEGCISIQRQKRWSVWAEAERVQLWPVIGMPQTDTAVLERFQAAVGGLGRINGPQILKNPNHSPRWMYQVRRYEHVQAVAAMLWPFLSPVKRDQIVRVMSECREHFANPPERPHKKPNTHCRNGHEFTPETAYFTPQGRRYCRLCTRANSRNYRKRQKV